MTGKILKSILAVAASVLSASFLIITGVLYSYFGNQQQAQLVDELQLAATGTQQMGISYLEALDDTAYRLTWVAEDGTVLFDTQTDEQGMENHGEREEIREALESGSGSSRRYSATLTEQYIYEAIKLEDGTVLRISESRYTVVVLVMGMLQPLIAIFVFAAILSAILAKRMARRIVEPLNDLNLEKPLDNEVYEELSPLLRRISVQQKEIRNQMQVLKQKQLEFDQITGNMKELLILLDSTGKIISINPAAKKWFGENTSPGQDIFVIDRRENMQNALKEIKQKDSSIFQESRNGREYQFEVSNVKADKKTVGIVILGLDITEQIYAEKNRRRFTANVSHELKTPLQSIMGSAELLENGIVKSDDVPRFMGHIRKEAARLVNLVDDIIKLSQLDEGLEMEKEAVSLHVLSEEICETLSDAAKKKGISLELAGEEGVVLGVRRLLYEIIYNLCDNAIKYNKQDGKVRISIEEQTEEVCIKVQDTGIGIASEEQEKIFERFYRVDKSHSKQSGGTGLGLSIVKHAVQCHQGRIHVESELNQGTCISVLFKIKNDIRKDE